MDVLNSRKESIEDKPVSEYNKDKKGKVLIYL